jgi:hypothetical protein
MNIADKITAIVLMVIGIVQVTFLVLKLTEIISWNWWIVFLPSLVVLGVFVLVIILAIVVAYISFWRE